MEYLKCNHAESIFFKGERAYYDSKEVSLILASYSSLIVGQDNRKLASLSKIVASCLLVSRNGFKTVWEHYEYPFLFFIGSGTEDNVVIERIRKNTFLEDILQVLTNTLVIYRSFEQDVLWVRKTADTIFPNF